MGSMEKAIKTGFICRLCSEMNKIVIHIYSDLGLKLKLAERIHDLLPVTVSVTDPLPKTVCWKCIYRLQEQHRLVQRIHYTRQQLLARKKQAECQTQPETTTTSDTSTTEEQEAEDAVPSLPSPTLRTIRVRKRPHMDPTQMSRHLRRSRR